MAPVVITGTLQIRVIWALNGADWAENVLHALIGAAPSVDQTMADAIASDASGAHASSGLNVLQPTAVTLDRVAIRDIRNPNQALIESPVGSAGTATSQLLPRGTALCVTLRTALAGKSFRGRSYVPGYGEDSNAAGGRSTAAAQAAAQAWITDLNQALTARGWPLAVASVLNGTSTLITQAVVRDAIWDGQRSRAFNGL